MQPAKLTSITKTYAHCPKCDHQMSTVDHLLKGKATSAGPWTCHRCSSDILIDVDAENTVRVSVMDPTKRAAYRPVLLLLRTITTPAVYFVVPARSFNPDELEENRYYYNEHTCPTNWIDTSVVLIQNGKPVLSRLQNVMMDVSDGEQDNHDMFEIVDMHNAETLYERLELEHDFAEKDHGVDWCHVHNEGLLHSIFPQAFEQLDGRVIDGETSDIEYLNIPSLLKQTE